MNLNHLPLRACCLLSDLTEHDATRGTNTSWSQHRHRRSVDPAPFLTVNKRMLTFYSETLGRLQASSASLSLRFWEDSRGRSCTSHQTVRLRQSSNSFLFVFLLLNRSDRFHVFPVSFFCRVLNIHGDVFQAFLQNSNGFNFKLRRSYSQVRNSYPNFSIIS